MESGYGVVGIVLVFLFPHLARLVGETPLERPWVEGLLLGREAESCGIIAPTAAPSRSEGMKDSTVG